MTLLKSLSRFKRGLIAVTLGVTIAGGAVAAGKKIDYDMTYVDWGFKGAFGTYDPAAMQRGYQVYKEVCAACHALEHIAFRHLGDKGGPYYLDDYPNPNDNPYVKALAKDDRWVVMTIDEDSGDMMERPAIPADYVPDPFPNDAAARASNAGALPPDLSVMVAARSGGADYLYNLLTAYDAPKPDDVTLGAGQHWNPVMDGGKIAMASPLIEGIIEYAPQEIELDDGTVETIQVEATVDQMAKDVTEFLSWTSDPKMVQRKRVGLGVMIYLSLLAILLYLTYQRVWRNVEH